MRMYLLSGEMGDLVGAFDTEELAEQAAWEYSERDGSHKEQTIAYMEENTSIDHIKDVYEWSIKMIEFLPDSGSFVRRCVLSETEKYALDNYKKWKEGTNE